MNDLATKTSISRRSTGSQTGKWEDISNTVRTGKGQSISREKIGHHGKDGQK